MLNTDRFSKFCRWRILWNFDFVLLHVMYFVLAELLVKGLFYPASIQDFWCGICEWAW